MRAPDGTSEIAVWLDWTTIVANITAIIAFIVGGIAAGLAGKKYFREKRHERLAQLYSYANALFRAQLTIQHQSKSGLQVDPTPLVKARAELKNWYFDNRFLFDDDEHLRPLLEASDDEAANFVKRLQMDSLIEFKKHLEKELDDSP
jgi:hypothetical protein